MKNTGKNNEESNENFKILFTKSGHEIVESKEGYRFAKIKADEDHVNIIYSDKYFFEGEAGYPNYLKERDLLIKYGEWYAELLSKYSSPGKVLDIGSAAGFILKGFVNLGWEGTGIEPNNTMSEYGRKTLNLDIHTGSFEQFNSEKQFDLITMIQVIGHFYDIEKVMIQVRKYLKPGGLILVESWNMDSKYAKIMGKYWHEYSPPSVLRWYSDESLIHFFEKNGFTLLDFGYPPKKINVNHAISLLKEKMRFPFKVQFFNILNRLFGKFNLTYPFYDLKWYLFRKNDV